MTAALQHWNILLPPGASVVEAVADLRATKADFANQIKLLVGYYNTGDAPSRTVWWDAASTATDDGGRIFQVTGVPVGRWKSTIVDFMDIRLWGAKLDDTADDHDAWTRALNSALRIEVGAFNNNVAGTFLFPDVGISYVSQAINCTSIFTLLGGGTHTGNDQSCIIRNPANVTGIILNSLNTTGETTRANGSSAAGSVIDGVSFRGGYWPGSVGTLGTGIRVRTRCILRNINVRGYAVDGVSVIAGAGAGGAHEGNANNWSMYNIRCQNNGRHGFYVDGADANAGAGILCDASSNGGYGIYESSFLGNVWVQSHTAANTLGSALADGLGGCTVWVGPYEESGQPASVFSQANLVLGGILNADPLLADFGVVITAAQGFLRNHRGYQSYMTSAGGNVVDVRVGGSPSNGDVLYATHKTTAPNPYRLHFSGNELVFDYNNSGALRAYVITGPNTTLSFGRSAAVPHAFASSRFFTRPDAFGRQITHSNAVPTSGEWAVGDIIFNVGVTAGGSPGWVCTTAGTGGSTAVFKAMANVAA